MLTNLWQLTRCLGQGVSCLELFNGRAQRFDIEVRDFR
jgi:hypothetical protein